MGPTISPFNSFTMIQGLETLSLRMERHVSNSETIAAYLEGHADVSWVAYAGLASSPWNANAKKYMPKGAGSILSFGLKGGLEAGKKFIEALQLHSHVANIGDVRSLAIHPATTTHSQLTADEQRAAGVPPELVRLSVGIESVADIIADLDLGFAAAGA
jgi:O-acetylhomoserine (thiol)-lyase